MGHNTPPDEVLARLGGVADAPTLLRHTTKSRLRTGLQQGRILRDGRGRYSLPAAAAALRAANRLTAVASHLSAATLLGWEVKTVPPIPVVTVPRNRSIAPHRREGVEVRWADLEPRDVLPGIRVTSPGRTVMDCAKMLPFDEALAVADSALRHGDVTKVELLERAGRLRRTFHDRCMRVARESHGRAANPFESVLRAIALDVPGLCVEPQVVIRGPGFVARPDLVDEVLRIAAEADSFEWHGKRSALRADCRRYNSLTVDGWLVLRFSWEDVMLRPGDVRACLAGAVRRRSQEHDLLGVAGRVPASRRTDD